MSTKPTAAELKALLGEWQWMDTAPKDGTPILVYSRGFVNAETREDIDLPTLRIIYWKSGPGICFGGYWAGVETPEDAEYDEVEMFLDTVWRHLPPLPDLPPYEVRQLPNGDTRHSDALWRQYDLDD